MIFLWTKNNLIGSKAIRWGTGEESSHFAMCFFEDRGDSALVVESTLDKGAGLDWFGDFQARNTIVRAVQVPAMSAKEEIELFHLVSGRLSGRKYDKNAIAYWAYRALARKFFDQPLPKRNDWGRNELVYCVEALEAMPEKLEELGIYLSEFDLEMTSPGMMYRILVECPYLIDITESF